MGDKSQVGYGAAGALGSVTSRNIVDSALAAGRELGGAQVIESPLPNGVPFIVLRDGDKERIEHIERLFASPQRVKGIYAMHDVASFLEYWARYSHENSVCYASIDPAQFVAIIDHHSITENVPAFEEHRALYRLAFSTEWALWTGRNGKTFEGNQELAAWLENQVPDIVEPEGANMLQIALNFKVNSAASFGNQVNLANGRAEFTFTNQVDGHAQVQTGKVAIPETFFVEIPVFAGLDAPKYRMEARFRYRLQSGSLKLWFELVRPHKVIETAFTDVLAKVTEKIGKSVLFGSPAA